jgi:hypothetical protein
VNGDKLSEATMGLRCEVEGATGSSSLVFSVDTTNGEGSERHEDGPKRIEARAEVNGTPKRERRKPGKPKQIRRAGRRR